MISSRFLRGAGPPLACGGREALQQPQMARCAVRPEWMDPRSPREQAALCFQCAKCSAGCPAAAQMSMLPHRAIHLLALGQESRVRRENTVWLCAACFTCATRCPNNVDIPGIFDLLRARWKLS